MHVTLTTPSASLHVILMKFSADIDSAADCCTYTYLRSKHTKPETLEPNMGSIVFCVLVMIADRAHDG